jgi:hypothetical protein
VATCTVREELSSMAASRAAIVLDWWCATLIDVFSSWSIRAWKVTASTVVEGFFFLPNGGLDLFTHAVRGVHIRKPLPLRFGALEGGAKSCIPLFCNSRSDRTTYGGSPGGKLRFL